MSAMDFKNTNTNEPIAGEIARTKHAYPGDLARYVRQRWDDFADDELGASVEEWARAPGEQTLESLFSNCYQAGLLREEERPVSFRVIFAPPSEFPEEDGPPEGLHRMEFEEPRPFDEGELRRLSPAANLERSLIGVHYGDEDEELVIWGIVHSGSRWLQDMQGGRELAAPLPPVPVVKVHEPGRLMVKRGSSFIAELSGGSITGSRSDVFSSRWIQERFSPAQAELLQLHHEAHSEAAARGESWAPLDADMPGIVAKQMVKRLVSIVREARHGATIVLLPREAEEEAISDGHIVLKHTFTEGEPRRRFRKLIVQLMNRLAQTHGKGDEDYYPMNVGWKEYVQSNDRTLAELDEAIFEFAHLVAGLAAIDGAVALTQHFELIGMGGEISGMLPEVSWIRTALDQEGDEYVLERTDGVGTRHRSAYRLAAALPDAMTIVFSQDGDIHFVKYNDGMVTCWDHA